jgi:hypothetical protein
MLGWILNLGFAASGAIVEEVPQKGGASMSLASMRARERAQLREMIRRDDEQVIPIIIAALRRRD